MEDKKIHITKPDQASEVPDGAMFTVLMNDSGMIDALIEAGDKLTVIRQDDSEVGSIVVAIHDDHLLIRRLGIVNDNFYLVPDNDGYIPVRKKDAAIVGKVISMQRNLWYE
jgi:repressor LexA